MFEIKFTQDDNGTPGFICPDSEAGFYGIGYLHACYRPLQTLILATAGRGRLSAELAPIAPLLHIDRLVHRYDLVTRGEREVQELPPRTHRRLDAYIRGVADGLEREGQPFELTLLMASLDLPTPASLLSGFLLASFMGLAESQGRMELSIVKALQQGADEALLQRMFSPHLDGWSTEFLHNLDCPDLLGAPVRPSGGSNAWAVTGEHTQSGAPLLAGDPHLQINQLPGLFFELRGRVGADYWLGATIPGLPGLAMGRNRKLSWAGTFAVADNIDYRGFEATEAQAECLHIDRRFSVPFRENVFRSKDGISDQLSGGDLIETWSGINGGAESLTAYLDLMMASSCEEAKGILQKARNFSLHFVLADRNGEVQYTQAGRIPKRSDAWSGLYPVSAQSKKRHIGFYEGSELPHFRPQAGMIVSANEARAAADGGVLSTLPQPDYRKSRIAECLKESAAHTIKSFQKIQLDVSSLRAQRLRPLFLAQLDDGFLKILLASWDGQCGPQSEGMSVFKLCINAALTTLAPQLGGDWFAAAYRQTELRVWWCEALDRILSEPKTWNETFVKRFKSTVKKLDDGRIRPWGDIQQIRFQHMIFGGLPDFLGLDRGPYPLRGSIGTICQGNVFRMNDAPVAIGPAYRFIASMDEEGLSTAIPGGIHGSRFRKSYVCWLDDYLAGKYHRIEPPSLAESEMSP